MHVHVHVHVSRKTHGADQLVIAREYGFRRWSELNAHSEEALVASLDVAERD